MTRKLRLGVFCSSRSDIRKEYFAEAANFAAALAERGYGMVYGGAQVGLMGHLADECLKRNVEVHGIIPHCLDTVEVAHTGLPHLLKVSDLFERKRLMLDLSDHFVVFPGGIGTLDELLEVLTWKVLGQWQGELILYDLNGFWQPFITLIEKLADEKCLGEETTSQFVTCASLKEMFEIVDARSHVGAS